MTPEPVDPIKPATAALLVMDYQNGIIAMAPDSGELLETARETISTMRERGGTVGYVRVAFADGDWDGVPETSHMAKSIKGYGDAFHVDHPNTQIPDQIAPQEGDIVVIKKRIGPFGTTDLHEQLQARGIDTLVLAGITTSGCVLSTVRDAHDRDYRVIVLADACADPDPEVHTFLMEKIFPPQVEVTTVAEFRSLLR